MFAWRNPVFWVVLALAVYSVGSSAILWIASLLSDPIGAAVGLVLWGLYTWLAFWIIRRLFRRRGYSMAATWAAFLWGAIIVVGTAKTVSPAVNDLVSIWVTDEAWATALTAGIAEETLKLVGLFALAFLPAARMRTPMDFVYYALFIGLGFEVVESFFYGAASGGGPIGAAVYLFGRGILNGLWSHPTYAAIAGAGLGIAMTGRSNWFVRIGSLLLLWATAVGLHAFFDSPLLEDGGQFLAAFGKGTIALVILVGVVLILRRLYPAPPPPATEEDAKPTEEIETA